MEPGTLTIIVIVIISLTSTAVFLWLPLLSPTFAQEYLLNSNGNGNVNSVGSNPDNKVVIINFDDGYKSQYEYAKPILDKYGFKATFFVVCNYADKGQQAEEEEDKQPDDVNYIEKGRMSWNDIVTLYQEGHDIEAHTVSHINLNKKSLTQQDLDYEIGQSKQCLLDHGINSNIFAYPFASGADNQQVVNTVAKYFTLARTGGGVLEMTNFGIKGISTNEKEDPQSNNIGSGNIMNRYAITAINHNLLASSNDYPGNSDIFAKFVDFVNSQIEYNKGGTINAIPIIVYHKLGYDSSSSSSNDANNGKGEKEKHSKDEDKGSGITDMNLFDREMAYLHNNHFKVLTMSSLQHAFPDYPQNSPKFTATNG
jgi:peptidoglycan/xylan/chitin deacetylase (PgdA/CDA1 family)